MQICHRTVSSRHSKDNGQIFTVLLTHWALFKLSTMVEVHDLLSRLTTFCFIIKERHQLIHYSILWTDNCIRQHNELLA